MKITIEEMKLVDSATAQLDKLALQVAAKEAAAKQEAVMEACNQFKIYFANRHFELSGSQWNMTATHGSIVFKLAIKNALTGGVECLVLHYPEMMKQPPVAIFLEARREQAAVPAVAASAPKGPLAEVQAKIDAMLDRLSSPSKAWSFYIMGEDKTGQAGTNETQRKEYLAFSRFLAEECP